MIFLLFTLKMGLTDQEGYLLLHLIVAEISKLFDRIQFVLAFLHIISPANPVGISPDGFNFTLIQTSFMKLELI
jgi:hypothetical protein